MSRRPEWFLVAAFLLLAGCGGSGNEAPAKSAVASSKPAGIKTEAQATSPPPAASAEAPATAAASAPAATPPTATPPPPAKTAPSAEPPFTPGTALPGAIPPSPAPADADADKTADPLKWLQDREARKADYQKRVAEAEANVAVANASIADWEKTILAFKNPYRPRPQLSPEDAQAIEGKDGIQRVAWGEEKLAAATAARDAAQKTLDDLRANPPSN
jgi:hypothetical protein